MKSQPPKGFSYSLNMDQIREYMRWSPERRLRWLYQGNKLRKKLPPEIVKTQEEFRQGKL